MKILDRFRKKEKLPSLDNITIPNIEVSIDKTTIGHENGHNIASRPVRYNPNYRFPDYFRAYITFFNIPPITHRIIQEHQDIYPLDMSKPLTKGFKAKPVSYSTNLITLFRKKEDKPEKGILHFGKVPVVLVDEKTKKTRRNDIALTNLIKQYRTDFNDKFRRDPFRLENFDVYDNNIKKFTKDAFHYPDSNGEIRGIDNVSKEQFSLYASNDTSNNSNAVIAIVDGITVGNENKPSTNGTSILNVKGVLKDIALGGKKPLVEIIASAPRSEYAKQEFDYTFATFGHQIFSIGIDKYSSIKGHTFIGVITQEPLLIPEPVLNRPDFLKNLSLKLKIEPSELREKYGLQDYFAFKDAR